MSTALLGVAPALSRSPLQALARLHTLAGAGLGRRESELGRPRDAAVRGPAPGDRPAAERLDPGVPALILAAVVHADLVTAAPFASHNGIVARAAERLVLVAKGVDG